MENNVEAILSVLNSEIDRMIEKLKLDLLNKETRPEAKRGLWDRFKNTLSNFFWGRYGQNNPYLWQNKLGDDLGRKAEVFSLSDYISIKEHFQKLENSLSFFTENVPGTENLAIVKIINNWGQELKQILGNVIKQKFEIQPNPTVQPTVSPNQTKQSPEGQTPVPQVEKAPEKDYGALSKELVGHKRELAEKLRRLQSKFDPKEFDKLFDDILHDRDLNRIEQRLNYYENPPDIDKFGVYAPSDKNRKKPKEQWEDDPRTSILITHDNKQLMSQVKSEEEWLALPRVVKMAWNNYGGGEATWNHGGRLHLPWIIRIGDPRREIIQHKRTSHIWRQVNDGLRWETEDDPIKNKDDFEDRIERIQDKLTPKETEPDIPLDAPDDESPATAWPNPKPTEAKPTEAKPTEAKPTEAKPTEAEDSSSEEDVSYINQMLEFLEDDQEKAEIQRLLDNKEYEKAREKVNAFYEKQQENF